MEQLRTIIARMESRYSLRFIANPVSEWQVIRRGGFIVGSYTLATYGMVAGELALKRLRQLQRLEAEARAA